MGAKKRRDAPEAEPHLSDWEFSRFKQRRSDRLRGKDLQQGFAALPSFRGESQLFGAESTQKLFAGPAGFTGYLRQKASRAPGDGEVNSVEQRLEIQWMCCGSQRGEDADFNFQPCQLAEGYRFAMESRILQHIGCAADDRLPKRTRMKPAHATSQTVRAELVQCDKAARWRD